MLAQCSVAVDLKFYISPCIKVDKNSKDIKLHPLAQLGHSTWTLPPLFTECTIFDCANP